MIDKILWRLFLACCAVALITKTVSIVLWWIWEVQS